MSYGLLFYNFGGGILVKLKRLCGCDEKRFVDQSPWDVWGFVVCLFLINLLWRSKYGGCFIIRIPLLLEFWKESIFLILLSWKLRIKVILLIFGQVFFMGERVVA